MTAPVLEAGTRHPHTTSWVMCGNAVQTVMPLTISPVSQINVKSGAKGTVIISPMSLDSFQPSDSDLDAAMSAFLDAPETFEESVARIGAALSADVDGVFPGHPEVLFCSINR